MVVASGGRTVAITGRLFRVFVGVPFGSMKEERNALQEHVFLRLRKLCTENEERFQAAEISKVMPRPSRSLGRGTRQRV
jgi:hypothetical protein